MPFKSKAQAKFMFAKHPDIAEEFAEKTKNIKNLPEHKKLSHKEYSERKKPTDAKLLKKMNGGQAPQGMYN